MARRRKQISSSCPRIVRGPGNAGPLLKWWVNMKKKKVLPAFCIIVVLTIGIAILFTKTSLKNERGEKPPEPVKAVPLVINTNDEKQGAVLIYCDGEVVYEYEGPIEIRRRDGKYMIEVQTFSCSCFDE